MIIHKNLKELVDNYIKNSIYLTNEDIEQMNSCSMVIEDIIPSNNYIEFDDGTILELE